MSQIIILNKNYSWNEMSLNDFISEGNTPLGWEDLFEDQKEELKNISKRIELRKKNGANLIYPPINWTFRAFIPLEKIKMVIIGQDPYHNGSNEGDGSAVGYCFSVRQPIGKKYNRKINPSLRNIYKELKLEGYEPEENGSLQHWVDQGCFLINASLTVEKSKAGSHSKFWQHFITRVIEYISQNTKGIAWILMGKHAALMEDDISSGKVFYLISS